MHFGNHRARLGGGLAEPRPLPPAEDHASSFREGPSACRLLFSCHGKRQAGQCGTAALPSGSQGRAGSAAGRAPSRLRSARRATTPGLASTRSLLKPPGNRGPHIGATTRRRQRRCSRRNPSCPGQIHRRRGRPARRVRRREGGQVRGGASGGAGTGRNQRFASPERRVHSSRAHRLRPERRDALPVYARHHVRGDEGRDLVVRACLRASILRFRWDSRERHRQRLGQARGRIARMCVDGGCVRRTAHGSTPAVGSHTSLGGTNGAISGRALICHSAPYLRSTGIRE